MPRHLRVLPCSTSWRWYCCFRWGWGGWSALRHKATGSFLLSAIFGRLLSHRISSHYITYIWMVDFNSILVMKWIQYCTRHSDSKPLKYYLRFASLTSWTLVFRRSDMGVSLIHLSWYILHHFRLRKITTMTGTCVYPTLLRLKTRVWRTILGFLLSVVLVHLNYVKSEFFAFSPISRTVLKRNP